MSFFSAKKAEQKNNQVVFCLMVLASNELLFKSQRYFSPNNVYLLAVSGGPDSMFLLDNMRIRDYKIVVAHVNYHKRIDSDYDENLVRNYCQKYSLPLEIYSVGDNEWSPPANFQSWARQVRYDFFRRVAKKYQTRFLVVAHHQQDHLETYWWQKKRHGLVDYWGLPAATRQGKLWILRPLLSLTKKQITHYLTAQKINYAVDSTNQQPIYQRNILRPYIANLKADVRLSLLKEIQKKNCELKKTKLLVKKQKKFFILSPAVFRLTTTDFSSEIHFRLLYYWINRASGGLLHTQKKKLLAEIYKQLFLSQKKNLIINLGSGWQIIKNSNRAVICSTAGAKSKFLPK